MTPELFFSFLVESLIQKHEYPKEYASEVATTILAKRKQIRNGEYAVLEVKRGSVLDLEEYQDNRIQYYKRIKNIWIRDDTIDVDTFIDSNTVFCNLKKECMKDTKNGVCETVPYSKNRLHELSKRRLLSEIDLRYTSNVDQIEQELVKRMIYYERLLKRERIVREVKLYSANNTAYEIGNMAKTADTGLVSPYITVRELILGQDDFIKKQFDICQFVNRFTRKPMVEELEEDPHWFYCVETNTKVFPRSLYELAMAFTQDRYSSVLDALCNDIGIISDDGDSIVDKHSGYVLRKFDFSSEEGYDEAGFRITTNDIMEEDISISILQARKKKERPVFHDETNEMIYNVFTSICDEMDIPIDSVMNDTMNISAQLIQNPKCVLTEESYTRRILKVEKEKGKKQPSYIKYKHETMILIISCILFVSIQTAMPSIRTTKTFPNCIRSFSGFPMNGGAEDKSGLTYIACVLNKMKEAFSPWDSLKENNTAKLVMKMQKIIETHVITRDDIRELYKKKEEFIQLYPNTVVPEELSITKWLHFLPPLVEFSILDRMKPISPDFKEDLIESIRKGKGEQFKIIGVLRSKIVQNGFAVMERINEIVKSKTLLLKTANHIPFLENACCNEDLKLTNPFDYFNQQMDGRNTISVYCETVDNLSRYLNTVHLISKAAMFYHPLFTGMVYPDTLLEPTEKTIYSAVIHYCHLDRDTPIPSKFHFLINEKIANYDKNASIEEKVNLLKQHGKQFTYGTLEYLMDIVHKDNTVELPLEETYTQIDEFADLISQMEKTNSTIIEGGLISKLEAIMNKYVVGGNTTGLVELRNLKNYLSSATDSLYTNIMDFLNSYGNLTTLKYNKLAAFLFDIVKWNDTSSSNLYTSIQYIENIIYSIANLYPGFLTSGQDTGRINDEIHDHWDISKNHKANLEKAIEEYYNNIENYKEDAVLKVFLLEIKRRLKNVNMFIRTIPLVRSKENEMNALFDQDTVNLLITYCLYSSIYEYVVCSDEPDLLRTDILKRREMRLAENRDSINDANLANTVQPNDVGRSVDDMELIDDMDMDIEEYQIVQGNQRELKEKVCGLLITMLEIEMSTKNTINLSYKDIKEKTNRSRDKEKKGIIKKFNSLTIEERKVENMLKEYRIGRWNVGQQKGLIQYDKSTYEREIMEAMALDDGEPMQTYDAEELEQAVEDDANAEEENDMMLLQQAGEDYEDGAYYDEDRDFDQ